MSIYNIVNDLANEVKSKSNTSGLNDKDKERLNDHLLKDIGERLEINVKEQLNSRTWTSFEDVWINKVNGAQIEKISDPSQKDNYSVHTKTLGIPKDKDLYIVYENEHHAAGDMVSDIKSNLYDAVKYVEQMKTPQKSNQPER